MEESAADPTNNSDELTPEHAVDVADGVMQVLQVLVVSLGTQGVLDTAHFARLLTDWRTNHTEGGSFGQVMVDRMLTMLVDEPEVLVRRASMRVVPAAPGQPDGEPSPPDPDPVE